MVTDLTQESLAIFKFLNYELRRH